MRRLVVVQNIDTLDLPFTPVSIPITDSIGQQIRFVGLEALALAIASSFLSQAPYQSVEYRVIFVTLSSLSLLLSNILFTAFMS